MVVGVPILKHFRVCIEVLHTLNDANNRRYENFVKQFKHGLESFLLFYLSHYLSCNLNTNLRNVHETGPRAELFKASLA